MKKTIALLASMITACSAMAVTAVAAESETAESVKAYVTIADGEKKTPLVQQEVTVTDIDEDGKLTINDALYIAHEENFEGGAEAGYGSADTQYGLSLTKLWGVENGGSYGYYVNNISAWGLADEISDNSYINAFVYSDLTAWSDSYTYFNENTAEAKQGDELELILSKAGFDADYNPVVLPVEGAIITVDGQVTDFVTDSEGKVTVKLENAGKSVISAVSRGENIVPPVMVADVAENAENTTTTTTAEAVTTTYTSIIVETKPETTKAATTTTKATTTKAATTTAKTGDSPKTGDKGAGVAVICVAVFAALGTTAFVLRRKDDEE